RHSISGGGQTSSPSISQGGPTGGIPTGPRAQSASSASASPSLGGAKPFNPPTGPSGHMHASHSTRPSLAQSLLNTMPPIIPGGKIDPTALPVEMDPHHKR